MLQLNAYRRVDILTPEYNASLMNSGAMLGGEGLAESAKGVRVAFPDGTAPKDKIEVTPGPFPAEGVHRVVCGFWLIKAKDLDEAIELAKKAPLQGGEVEIRRVHGTYSHLGASFSSPVRLSCPHVILRAKYF